MDKIIPIRLVKVKSKISGKEIVLLEGKIDNMQVHILNVDGILNVRIFECEFAADFEVVSYMYWENRKNEIVNSFKTLPLH